MKKRFYIIVLLYPLFLLTSCGIATETKKSYNVHPDAVRYVQKFESLNKKKISDLEVFFVDLDNRNRESEMFGVAAYCTWKSIIKKKTFKTVIQNTPQIFIDKTTWSELANSSRREALVFHELGHCIQDKEHDDKLDTDNTPISIMYPMILSEDVYLRKYSHYLAELFSLPTSFYASYDNKYYIKDNENYDTIKIEHSDNIVDLTHCVKYNETIVINETDDSNNDEDENDF